MSNRAILLIGGIAHSKAEWEALKDFGGSLKLKAYESGSREDFLSRCTNGDYDDVEVVYRSNQSTKVTGPFDSELVSSLPPNLKFICHNGAGYDNIDVTACTERNIEISNTPDVVTDATADVAIFLLIGALRLAQIPLTTVRAGRWQGSGVPLGHDPRGKLLGILGMGSIGRAVASRARAFGMRVQYHNRNRLSTKDEGGAEYVDFKTLMETSDVLSLNCKLTAETTHIIGRSELDMMKPGVVIINTARGKLIDEAALAEALESSDKIWSVGLDVFEDEPIIHEKLANNPRVFLLPHIGTSTFETQKDMELLVIENVKHAILKGKLVTRITEQKQMA